jgi:hypothetical protein
MSVQATLGLRKQELRRRVEALPNEVKKWQDRTQNDLDSNVHFSQLQAIGILMDTFAEQQANLLEAMDPTGNTAVFQDAAFELVKSIIRSQGVWDFFRDKLDLRFSPIFKEVLWVADTVAWDCYRPVLDTAADAGILMRAALREPPLSYLTAEFSPATWIRGSRPNDGRNYHLGTAQLPIPVIELPWDHVENTWEFMSLHHEVGHDLEADLKLREVLATSLQTTLGNATVPSARIQQWLNWQGEVFADLVGLQLGGPAFAEALMHLLLLPAGMVTTFDPNDPHPTHYPRILMNAAYIPTMIQNHQPLADHGQQIADRWIAVYGKQSHFDAVINDFPLVFRALMDIPLPSLNGMTVRQLIPYTAADDQRIRNAVGFLRTGMNRPGNLRPRHCISAARMAVTQVALEEALSKDLLNQVNQRTIELVRSNAPSGLRGGDTSAPHKKFIASFAKEL